jgi:SdpI/YfhL protein family
VDAASVGSRAAGFARSLIGSAAEQPIDVVITSRIAFPALGLATLIVGWPLAHRRVPPNRWYGLRVPATFADPRIWYEANAVCGDDLVRLGAVLLAVALGLQFLSGLPELGYVMICLAVLVVGSLRATIHGVKVARKLQRQQNPNGSRQAP